MFGIGTTELFIILLIVIVFIGPKKLPELARGLAKGMREFRRATSNVRSKMSEFEDHLDSAVRGDTREQTSEHHAGLLIPEASPPPAAPSDLPNSDAAPTTSKTAS